MLRIYNLLRTRFGPHTDKRFISLLFLMFISAITESISIGAIYPYLTIATEPTKALEIINKFDTKNNFSILDSNQLLFNASVVYIAINLIAYFLRILTLRKVTNISYELAGLANIKLFEVILNKPYTYHANNNSSKLVASILTKSNSLVHGLLLPLLNAITTFGILISTLIILLYVNTITTVLALLGIITFYTLLVLIVKRNLQQNSSTISDLSSEGIKCLQEALSSIRDIIIDQSQQYHVKKYSNFAIKIRNAEANSVFIGASPKLILECIIISAIILYVMIQSHLNGLSSGIATIGLFAMAGQRIMPQSNQLFGAWASYKHWKSSLIETIQILSEENKTQNQLNKTITFKNTIQIKSISHRFKPNGRKVLCDINLEIRKGSKIGIIGESGSGKSTLIDVVLGLISPISGNLYVDNVRITSNNIQSWQSKIAHVSQHIYLLDASIAENVALTNEINTIDIDRVKFACTIAGISEDIETFPNGYFESTGENGIKLSGGQRQRICIARAIYKKAELLILDEATSALDTETESKFTNALNKSSIDLTVIMIAHRISTLKECDYIVELKSGNINRICSYNDLING